MSQPSQQLRAALESLRSYELPPQYRDDAGDDNDGSTRPPLLDAAALGRYRDARSRFLRQRTEELFATHLATYDGSTFQFPPIGTSGDGNESSEEERRRRQGELLRSVKDAVLEAEAKHREVRDKYDAFDARRTELGRIVDEMEGSIVGSNDIDVGDEEGGDVDEHEMALQEERLANLIRRKSELEARLRSVRSEGAVVEEDCARLREAVNGMRQKRGAPHLDDPFATAAAGGDANEAVRAISPETVAPEGEAEAAAAAHFPSKDEMEKEMADLHRRAAELRDMSAWYDSVRMVVEELGGMQILCVEDAGKGAGTDGVTNMVAEDRQTSPTNGEGEEQLRVKIRLLGRHILQVGLRDLSTSSDAAATVGVGGGVEDLRVSSATFLTDSVITTFRGADGNNDDDKIDNSNGPVVSMSIPPLEDLVRLGSSLGPVDDMRFVVRETMARVRAVEARVDELARLKGRYLAKVGVAQDGGGGFGAAQEQEVVCTVNEGVSVVLRLGSDCPLIAGSVCIDQIVGVGGWDANVLGRIKDSVNDLRLRGPVDVMDALVAEIGRVEREEGITVPRTPSLPKRGKDT